MRKMTFFGMELAMVSVNNAEKDAVFQAINDDGTRWLFVIIGDEGWVITCNGEQMAVGINHGASIDSGVLKFLSFTNSKTSQLRTQDAPRQRRSAG
jgi:hypothetical protein